MVGVPCQREGAGRTEQTVSVWGAETAALRGCSDLARECRGGRGTRHWIQGTDGQAVRKMVYVDREATETYVSQCWTVMWVVAISSLFQQE